MSNKPKLLPTPKNKIIGDYIKSGTCRDIYNHSLNSAYVVKVAKNVEDNYNEVYNFRLYEKLGIGRYFSPSFLEGDLCIMLKAEPLKEEDIVEVPTFILDCGYGNCGMLEGKGVCVDYQRVVDKEDLHKWFDNPSFALSYIAMKSEREAEIINKPPISLNEDQINILYRGLGT